MQYRAFSHTVTVEEITDTAYGIIVLENNIEIKRFYDLTFDEREIDRFVSTLNECKVELVHLEDVVDDFLIR